MNERYEQTIAVSFLNINKAIFKICFTDLIILTQEPNAIKHQLKMNLLYIRVLH